MKLSVVISAYNEEKKIKQCLESAAFADEIIFLDNSSTDKTPEIAKKYTKKFYSQKNDPAKIDLQKNAAIEKATGDWVLVLDGDEEITTELRKEIEDVVLSENNTNVFGYRIPRKNIIFNKWIRHSGWYPDYQLRLFKRGKGKYNKEHYHEPIVVTGEIKDLTEHLLHHNFETVSQFLYKHLQVYAPNEASERMRTGYVFRYQDAIQFPLQEFLSRYFAREGYKDGFHGLVLSLLMAVYHLAIFIFIWEKKQFIDEKQAMISDSELNDATKQIKYWLHKKTIEEEANPLKKISLQVKKKFSL